ncbi:GIY-YIG nuclease family protein [Methanogenium organophilum]|uniref:GIY-YIG domain-containing protein n=1 Tax=Methanogenium organophilum TaxID=2199 RepID=A0A9X9S4K9_METOG|nr:hypothetical protein [Methanogenium organophilum]WAI01365.1 hypothetical protein OU421_00375 [Methanogenium organophilum]
MDYFSDSWCSLKWSRWAPLQNYNKELSNLSNTSGLYRIRPIQKDFLMYIGQTGRSLRERMGQLRIYTRSESEMPFNDPHTAAPSLWAWRDAEGWEFECSVASVEFNELTKRDSKQMREGFESYLLWRYRLEKGESTLCNFGRFHPQYFKSSSRSSGRRGDRLSEDEINISGGPSLPPLNLKGSPCNADWMDLDWKGPIPLTKGCGGDCGNSPGLYKIMFGDEVVYIGQSSSLKSRLNSHVNKNWEGDPEVAVCMTDVEIREYQLHEWENDLIAGFFSEYNRPPKYQFKNLE